MEEELRRAMPPKIDRHGRLEKSLAKLEHTIKRREAPPEAKSSRRAYTRGRQTFAFRASDESPGTHSHVSPFPPKTPRAPSSVGTSPRPMSAGKETGGAGSVAAGSARSASSGGAGSAAKSGGGAGSAGKIGGAGKGGFAAAALGAGATPGAGGQAKSPGTAGGASSKPGSVKRMYGVGPIGKWGDDDGEQLEALPMPLPADTARRLRSRSPRGRAAPPSALTTTKEHMGGVQLSLELCSPILKRESLRRLVGQILDPEGFVGSFDEDL